MRIAYLMMVHKNPRLLARAIRTLSSEQCGFFIHIDRKADPRQFSGISGKNVFLSEPTLPVYWGEFSQVEATIKLVRQALTYPVPYDYLVFLQGSDYPLRSGRYIQQFLDTNRGFEFINLVKMPAPGYPLTKINKLRYPSDKPLRRFVSRVLAKAGLAQRDYRRNLGVLDAFAGHAYWTLSREACRYMVDFAESNPYLEGYFRNAFTSDEMFFHTILGNSSFRNRVRKSLLFVDPNWSIADDRRHLVKAEHVSFFEAQDKLWIEDEWGSGEVLFARKFCDDTLDLVDRIDAMIRRKERVGQFS